MKNWTKWLGLALLIGTSVWWLSGCGGTTSTPGGKPAEKKKDSDKADQKSKDHKEGDHKDHKEGDQKDHKEGDHKEHKEGDHHDKALTEKDVKVPTSFKAGVSRQEELHKEIAHQIEHGELAKVHRTAEEMALVAQKMKELAQKDVAEDKRIEAGRLCNELAGYYKPIDEVADAGKKAETEAIHKKMGETITKLKDLAM